MQLDYLTYVVLLQAALAVYWILDHRLERKLRRRIRALEEARFWERVVAEDPTVENRLRCLQAQAEEIETRGESE